jgi:hypothetical protein
MGVFWSICQASEAIPRRSNIFEWIGSWRPRHLAQPVKFNPMRHRIPLLKRVVPSIKKRIAKARWRSGHAINTKERWKMRQFPVGTSEHAGRLVRWFNDCIRSFDEQDDPPNNSFWRLLHDRGQASAARNLPPHAALALAFSWSRTRPL